MPILDLIDAAADLVLPRCCVACGVTGTAWCPACRPEPELLGTWLAGVPVVAAGRYAGGLRSALLAYKERGRRDLRGPLATLLDAAVAAVTADVPIRATLVPVPSSGRARRARGGDHVMQLVRPLVRGRPVDTVPALRLVRPTRDSAGLTEVERSANLGHAMFARPPRPDAGPAIVVDDIATTGASLTESIRALRAAGWTVAGAAVIAVTPRRAAGGRHWQGMAGRASVR